MPELFYVVWLDDTGRPFTEADDLEGEAAVELAHKLATDPDRPEVCGVWVVESENDEVQLSWSEKDGLFVDRPEVQQ